GGNKFDLPASERVVLLLQECDNPLFHLDAALRERAGLDREQAELEWRSLRDGGCREIKRRGSGASGRSDNKFTTSDFARHLISSLLLGLSLGKHWRCGLI